MHALSPEHLLYDFGSTVDRRRSTSRALGAAGDFDASGRDPYLDTDLLSAAIQSVVGGVDQIIEVFNKLKFRLGGIACLPPCAFKRVDLLNAKRQQLPSRNPDSIRYR